MDMTNARATGWDEITDLNPETARTYGLPGATQAYRKIVSDGALVVVVSHDDHGYAFALSHVAHFDHQAIIPGRLPTFSEVYCARRVLIPNETVLMVALLEPMSFALRLRWERVQSAEMLPVAPGLPTTVKVVQMFCEGVTEDCVFGTQDVPTPTPAGVYQLVVPESSPDFVGPKLPPVDALGFTEDDEGEEDR
jgi:hypothetical protein